MSFLNFSNFRSMIITLVRHNHMLYNPQIQTNDFFRGIFKTRVETSRRVFDRPSSNLLPVYYMKVCKINPTITFFYSIFRIYVTDLILEVKWQHRRFLDILENEIVKFNPDLYLVREQTDTRLKYSTLQSKVYTVKNILYNLFLSNNLRTQDLHFCGLGR